MLDSSLAELTITESAVGPTSRTKASAPPAVTWTGVSDPMTLCTCETPETTELKKKQLFSLFQATLLTSPCISATSRRLERSSGLR